MRTLGIEIKGNTAIFTALEENGELNNITGNLKKLELKDDEESQEIRGFVDIIHSHFNDMKFDKIGISKRSKSVKSRFPPSPISFKLEGLIQLYKELDIHFVAPQTVAAFLKKNDYPIEPEFSYQDSSCKLAFYLLKND